LLHTPLAIRVFLTGISCYPNEFSIRRMAHHVVGTSFINAGKKMQEGMIKEQGKNAGVRNFCRSIHLPHDIPRERVTGICR